MKDGKISDEEWVRWQLKYLNEKAGEMRQSDLEWAVKMEEAFNRYGRLTERQMEILREIYERY